MESSQPLKKQKISSANNSIIIPSPVQTKGMQNIGMPTSMMPSTSIPAPNTPTPQSNNNMDDSMEQYNEDSDATPQSPGKRKPRFVWSPDLHQQFLTAVNALGENAVPKAIFRLMKNDNSVACANLTTEHIKSHLQKFRLKKRQSTSNGNSPTAAPVPSNIMEHNISNNMFSSEGTLAQETLQQQLQIQKMTLQMQEQVQSQLRQQLSLQQQLQQQIERFLNFTDPNSNSNNNNNTTATHSNIQHDNPQLLSNIETMQQQQQQQLPPSQQAPSPHHPQQAVPPQNSNPQGEQGLIMQLQVQIQRNNIVQRELQKQLNKTLGLLRGDQPQFEQ